VPLGIDGEIPAPSPDGKFLAYYHQGFQVAPLGGGPPLHTITSISGNNYSMLRWTPDSKALLHNAGPNDRKNVWLQPLDGSPARPVTHFDDQYVLRFDVTPDGKALGVVRGVLSRDAVLIKNFR
jgi:Tol biopolymer transport system component